MAFNNTIQTLEINQNLETVLGLLQQVAPNNVEVSEAVGQISKTKSTFIKQLKTLWESRQRPLYTEIELREENARYLSEENNEIAQQASGANVCHMDNRSWIIKSSDIWRGFHIETSS